MRIIIFWGVVGGLAGVLLLALSLILAKALRDRRAARRAARRARIEPGFLEFVVGANGGAAGYTAGLRRRERDIAGEIAFELLERVRGDAKSHLGAFLDRAGIIDRDIRVLGKSSADWRRAQAAYRLGLSGVERARVALGEALDDSSDEVVIRAAEALAAQDGTEVIGLLIGALRRPGRWSVLRIAEILMSMGEEAQSRLMEVYWELEPSSRRLIVDILGRTRAVTYAAWLRDRLSEGDLDIVARASHSLGEIRDSDSADRLVGVVRGAHGENPWLEAESPSWPARAMAAQALGELRHEAAAPALADAMEDPEWWVRENAANALMMIGPEGAAALEEVMVSSDRYAAQQAVYRLELLGVVDEMAGALVVKGRRRDAGEFMDRVIATGRVERLTHLAANHPDPRVQLALLRRLAAAEVAE